MIKEIRFTKEWAYCWLIFCVLSRTAIRFTIIRILSLFRMSVLSSVVLGLVMLLPLIIATLSDLRHSQNETRFILIYLFFYLYFEINLAFHPSYEQYYTRDVFGIYEVFFQIARGSIWALLAFSGTADGKKILRVFHAAAYVMFFYSVYELLHARSVGYWQTYNALGEMTKYDYSLTYGYQVIFCCIVFLYYFFARKNWIDLICSIISFIFVFTDGSRGAFICLATFIILFLLIKAEKLSLLKKISLSITIALIFYFISSNYDLLIKWIISELSKLNINSRTLSLILTGNFAYNSGRNVIYELCWAAIKEQRFWGMGAFGNRTIIAPLYYWGYPHHIVIEFIMDFGIVPGFILLAIIVWNIFIMFHKIKGDSLIVFIILLSMVMKLFFSSSYWAESSFWAMIGWMFVSLRILRKSEKNKSMVLREKNYYAVSK